MKLNGNKKILLLGLILLIIAGIVVVALKGFEVPLIYQQHESINLMIGKEVKLDEFKQICDEVFQNKEVVLRNVELFNDSVNINVENITDEEKQALVEKVNEKYGTEFTVDGITIQSNSNIRIRDIVRPYVKPIIISVLLIAAYMIIRFRKMSAFKLLGNIILYVILTEAALASILAIVRIPVSPILINLMAVIAIIELIVYLNKKEKEYKTIE